MKTLSIIFLLFFSLSIYSQNWVTTGGNMQKNGVSKLTGPSTANVYWTVNSTNSSLWGNTVLSWGNKFVTSRVTFSPSYRAKLELRDLTNGQLIWEKQITDTSIMYAVGFNEDAVYANDYKTGRLYALNISDGSVKWFVASGMFGGNTGILFTNEGDVITFGRRINKLTGLVLWTNNYPIPVGPDESYCIYGNTYYHWTGTITTPKTLIAIDLSNGQTRYTSSPLPGDGDQENDLIIGPDGVIYITRDGGALHAFNDNGTAFQQLWSNPAGFLVKGFARDGTIYAQSLTGRLVRLNRSNGSVIDSTSNIYGSGLSYIYSRIATAADSTVFFNTGEVAAGRYFAFTPDIQAEKWVFNAPYNYYSCPNLGKEGVLVMIGAGTAITAYKTTAVNLKPVADLYARSASHNCNVTYNNQPVNFFDQSSYSPNSWQWSFPGSNTPTSTQQNPVNIIYPAIGVYNVSLTAVNAFGSDTLVRSSYIVVYPFLGIAKKSGEIPEAFSISQNYPNPFNPITNFELRISNYRLVIVKIFDSWGREVTTLVNEKLNPGVYNISFDGSGYSSGVYFYSMIVDDVVIDTKKMVLIK